MLSLEPGETIGGGLTRIARATLDRAIAHLEESPADIHKARVRFKEIRATLRLGRCAAGKHFQELDQLIRDAGKQLAQRRDADVLLATAGSLHDNVARDRAERQALSRMRGILAAGQGVEPDVVDAARSLRAARESLAFDGGPESLDRGLRRTYRDGRRLARSVREEGNPAAIHVWRKHVKYLWHQTQLLSPVWPQILKGHIAALGELSHLLGEHHDLFSLDTLVAEEQQRFGEKTALRIAAVVARRFEEIEPEAFRIGRLVYAESPRGWSARLVRYWRTWTGTLLEMNDPQPDSPAADAEFPARERSN